MILSKIDGLTPMQVAFVAFTVEGFPPKEAAKRAGYADYVQSSTNLLNSPAVAAAIHKSVQVALQGDAPINLAVLRKIRDDDAAPARTRADISIKLLALAGFVQPSKSDGKAQKPISEMTQAELIDYVEANRAIVDRAEAELASKAKDVTPGDSVPRSVPEEQGAASNALSYLD